LRLHVNFDVKQIESMRQILLGLALLSCTSCAAFKKDPKAAVVALIGCGTDIARTIAGAIHAGSAAWVDITSAALAGVSDIASCVDKIEQLETAAHGCADMSGESCYALPTEEAQRLRVQLPIIARAVMVARTKTVKQ